MQIEEPKTPEDFYTVWQADPTPGNLHGVVKSLDNVVGYKLSSMGLGDNPKMRHQAKLMTAEAVRKFDPASGARLGTWTQNHLKGMSRVKRENQGPVKLPDRAVIDAWKLEKATRELEDELGMEPDVKHLADRTGIPVKRIADVRRITRPVAAAEQMYTEGDTQLDFLGEALEYVYDESDPLDRKIIEFTTGYGGVPMMQKNEIAQRLGISASQVTRRAARIESKVQEMDSDLEEVHT